MAVLRHLNTTHRRTVPEDAPVDFIERKWLPYVVHQDGHWDRHYYELCVLWALRNALREFLFFANKGTIRRKQEEDQANQAGCLNLLTNAVVVWNTVYMAAVIDQLRAEGYPVREEDMAHLSSARFEQMNP